MCENRSFSIQINNLGEDPETNILLSVAAPNGYEYVAGSTNIDYPGGVSEVDPQVSGSLLDWNLTNIMGTDLKASESIDVSFNLTALCEAVYGDRVQINLTSATGSSNISSKSIEVNFPIMKLEKTPEVVAAHRLEKANYSVSVENTGPGPMYNVLVNDSPTAGLILIASTAGGLNWSYDKLEPGEKRTENLSFLVDSCVNLVNGVNATWGCNSTPCGRQWAKGSVLFISKDPNLDYSISPDPISVPYCEPDCQRLLKQCRSLYRC